MDLVGSGFPREPHIEAIYFFLRIHAVFLWNPFIVQVHIAFPLDQELNFSSMHPGIKDSCDFVLDMVINDLRRGWRRSLLGRERGQVIRY